MKTLRNAFWIFIISAIVGVLGIVADSWDKTVPTGSTPFPLVDDQIRTNQSALEERFAAEHQFPSNPFTSHTSGRHKFGIGNSAARDAALSSPQNGMVWFHSDFGWQLYNSGWRGTSAGIGSRATRDAVATPTTNALWFLTAEGFASYYDGTRWVTFGPKGLLHARIAYTAASQVTLSRGDAQRIRVEIDGVLLEGSSDLVWDVAVAGDREDTAACGGSASEQASTWYYLYVRNNAGVIEEEMSSTPPVMDPASGKVGYHPGTCNGATGWRAVGAVFNNSLSNIQPFDYDTRTGLWSFRSIVSAFTTSPGTGAQTTYTTAALTAKIPLTARTVRLQAEIGADDHVYWYGHESVTGTAATSPTPNKLTTRINSTNNDSYGTLQFEIAVDATPAFAWGNADEGSGGSRNLHRVDVVGWYDDLGISN